MRAIKNQRTGATSRIVEASRTDHSADKNRTGRIFLINKISATCIIPAALARKHGLDHPRNVVIEDTPGGILIRKLDL